MNLATAERDLSTIPRPRSIALDVNPLWVRGSRVEPLDGLAVARTV